MGIFHKLFGKKKKKKHQEPDVMKHSSSYEEREPEKVCDDTPGIECSTHDNDFDCGDDD